ncbi:TRAP transporter [Alicycliphilus sp. B1]|nr:TRAP transporter [Alicycliphilus sp. B1]
MAPMAPMAPPSVGVATPRKMVPSTRKISSSGGISTKVTRSASLDSRPRRVTRLASAISQATKVPPHMATTIFSSVGTDSTSSPCHQVCTASMFCASTTATAVDSRASRASDV